MTDLALLYKELILFKINTLKNRIISVLFGGVFFASIYWFPFPDTTNIDSVPIYSRWRFLNLIKNPPGTPCTEYQQKIGKFADIGYLFWSFRNRPIFDLKWQQQSSEKGSFFGRINPIDIYLKRSDQSIYLMEQP